MSSIKLKHSSGNGVSIAAPSSNPAADRSINLNDNYAGDGSFVTANSSGHVGIGTASPNIGSLTKALTIAATSSSNTAGIEINGNSSTTNGRLGFYKNGTIASKIENYDSDQLIFSTGTGGTERMRLRTTTGGLMIGNNGSNRIGEPMLHVNYSGASNNCASFYFSSTDDRDAIFIRHDRAVSSNTAKILNVLNGSGSTVGSITCTASATAFNTSSDYRLKQDNVLISDGISRLKTLKPYRFKWKADISKTVDGFFAHEAALAVPEAVTGTKDETYGKDDDSLNIKSGAPKYQQIDQSKLVPLLTAALQEAIAKIEVLEIKVATLEAA
jgi:hypothetical protein